MLMGSVGLFITDIHVEPNSFIKYYRRLVSSILVEHRSAMQEAEGLSPRLDQHSGS